MKTIDTIPGLFSDDGIVESVHSIVSKMSQSERTELS